MTFYAKEDTRINSKVESAVFLATENGNVNAFKNEIISPSNSVGREAGPQETGALEPGRAPLWEVRVEQRWGDRGRQREKHGTTGQAQEGGQSPNASGRCVATPDPLSV